MKHYSAGELFDKDVATLQTDRCKSDDLCLLGQKPPPSRQTGSAVGSENIAGQTTFSPGASGDTTKHALSIKSLIPPNSPEPDVKPPELTAKSPNIRSTTELPGVLPEFSAVPKSEFSPRATSSQAESAGIPGQSAMATPDAGNKPKLSPSSLPSLDLLIPPNDDPSTSSPEPLLRRPVASPILKPGLPADSSVFAKGGDPRYPSRSDAPARLPLGDHPGAAVNKQAGQGDIGDTLRAAVQRAKNGGRPLTITQIGDSHIAAGIETPAIAAKLAADLGLRPDQVSSTYVGRVNETAPQAKDDPKTFMRNVNKDTDLVIVSFGSNDSTKVEGADYKRDYETLIGQIRSRDHSGAILMTGPFDGNYWGLKTHLPGLDSVRQAQASVAAEVPNSAYTGVASRLGLVASMKANGLMGSDNLHLTTAGYEELGGMFADDIAQRIKTGP